MPITSLDQLNVNQHYTYADYLGWKLKERVELFKGRIVKMSPAPNVRHQQIVGTIGARLFNHLEGSKYQVFVAPFDVRLPLPRNRGTDEELDTVVQPDVCVICDPNKLDERGCIGAPDLVVEVLSPGNTTREMHDKFELYESAGVLEYWVLDPEREHLLIYIQPHSRDGFRGVAPKVAGDFVESVAVTGFKLDLREVLR